MSMMNGDFAWYAPFFYLSGFAKVLRGVKTLPQTLGEALAALSADTAQAKALGDDFVAEYLATKTPEWIDYCRSASDWEYKRYLTWP